MSHSSMPSSTALDAQATAGLLPWNELAEEIAALGREMFDEIANGEESRPGSGGDRRGR